MCTVCKLWTCELHGAASHVSHASQLLKHDAIVECEAENDEDNADIEDVDDNADVAENDFNDELDDEVAEDNGVHFSRPLAKSIKRTRRK